MKLLSFGLEGGKQTTITVRKHVHIGRATYNGVVIDDERVCPSHAVLRISGEQALIEDLGSENGTWVDGARIDRLTPVTGPVRIGGHLFHVGESDLEPTPSFLLEEVATGIRHPLSDGSFLIGDAPGADIHVPSTSPVGLTIQQGRLLAGSRVLAVPWQGRLGGIAVRLLPRYPSTRSDRIALTLRVCLAPPAAHVRDATSGAHHTIRAPNRVTLLYYLANAQLEDLADGVEEERIGWRSDENVAVAVWGRGGRTGSRNRLNTLTYRLRGELAEQGITASILEKMSGWMRLEPCAIELDRARDTHPD